MADFIDKVDPIIAIRITGRFYLAITSGMSVALMRQESKFWGDLSAGADDTCFEGSSQSRNS
jgi:hypothetical protein